MVPATLNTTCGGVRSEIVAVTVSSGSSTASWTPKNGTNRTAPTPGRKLRSGLPAVPVQAPALPYMFR